MAKEIERKFRVVPGWLPTGEGDFIAQGYLATSQKAVVRVRLRAGRGYLTVKSSTDGVTRDEFEYEISEADARAMLKLCETSIEKHRYLIPEETGHTWEVDVFHGANEGLVVAEIELASPDEPYVRPSWLAREVSSDPRYFNCNLSLHPFSEWEDKD